ncbi:MAG: hypothetical protein PHP23_13410 [Desulfobacterales bacterium]|nr:hypothetical protein [Desulfobacterales bacterium]MDD4072902.1 hypothetical protein [Desulfobacterales bacterium]MDD4393740.1 hypothetical protein [Desulfobacterales bacterium]
MNLIEAKQASNHGTLPFSIHSAYKWHSKKKYPNLLVKVAGKLFVDLDEWEKMAETAKKEQGREAARLRNLNGAA